MGCCLAMLLCLGWGGSHGEGSPSTTTQQVILPSLCLEMDHMIRVIFLSQEQIQDSGFYIYIYLFIHYARKNNVIYILASMISLAVASSPHNNVTICSAHGSKSYLHQMA